MEQYGDRLNDDTHSQIIIDPALSQLNHENGNLEMHKGHAVCKIAHQYREILYFWILIMVTIRHRPCLTKYSTCQLVITRIINRQDPVMNSLQKPTVRRPIVVQN